MRLSITEFEWLLSRACPNADAAALTRIEAKMDALAAGQSALAGHLDMQIALIGDLPAILRAIRDEEDKENTMSQALDSKLDELGTKEDAVIALLNTDTSEIAALQAAVTGASDDTAAQAKAQALIDKLTAVLPAPAPAPAGGDTTGGTDTTGSTTDTTGGGDQTPVPVDGGAGDGSAPSGPTA